MTDGQADGDLQEDYFVFRMDFELLYQELEFEIYSLHNTVFIM